MSKLTGKFQYKNLSEDLKKIISNFGYLSILQVLNLVLPLIIFPFLIDRLGKENYGLVIYAQAIITFLVVIVNFGFNITATQQISSNRENINKISEIVSSVLILKTGLVVIATIILAIILPFIKSAENNYLLFYLSMYLCLNELVFPVWYFQGIEEMKFITFLNFVSKSISIILLLIFIKAPGDYLMVPMIYFLGTMTSGLLSIRIIFFKHKIRFVILEVREIFGYARSSFYIFISRASFMLMESTSKVIVTSFFGLSELSVYDLILRVTSVLRKPFLILSQAFFPNLSKTGNMKMAKRILYYSTVVGIVFYALLMVFSDYIALFFLDEQEKDSVFKGFLILGLSIPLSCLTWGLGENALVVKGYIKEYNISTITQIFVYFVFTTIFYLILGTLTFEIILILYILPIFIEVLLRIFYVKKYSLFGNN